MANTYRTLTEEDISEGKKLATMFLGLSEVGRSMAISYLSALRDKEVMEKEENDSVAVQEGRDSVGHRIK